MPIPGLLLIAAALAFGAGCAPRKQTTSVPTNVCTALAGTGPLEARLAAALPLQVGGALYLFEGTQPSLVLAAIEPLGLQQSHVVGCGTDQVVVFVPGVMPDAVVRLEATIVGGAKARTKEAVAVPPQSASQK
jgi:hypothetical protein